MGSIPQLSVLKGPTRQLKPNYLHRIFEENVLKYPENVALMFEGQDKKLKQHTYKSLNEETNKFARYLTKVIKNQSLERNNDGDYIIAVCMKPSDDLVKVLLGIWKAGCAYLPLDPTFPANRIEHILRESKPCVVISTEDGKAHEGLFDQLSHKLNLEEVLGNLEGMQTDNLRDNEQLHHLKDDLAIVLYTSGSTGIPKGVRLPHRVLLNRLQWQFKTFPYSNTETVGVFKTALTFVDSVSEIWGPLLNGRTVLVVPKCVTTDPERLINTLDKYKIERLVLVPSLLRSILIYLKLKNNPKHLQSLKIWVCSGETLVVSLAQEFFDHFPIGHILCNFYGSTEIMGDVTYHVIQNKDQLQYASKVPIGIPVDNTMLYLLDKDFRPVKAGDVGELFVAGFNLAAGYVNNRDPEKFINNPLAIDPMYSKLFRTGDFASVEKGALRYEGRTDSQVKIRGHRVDLSEVDKAVNSLEEVEKGIVLCYKPGEINQALLAFVTTTNSRVTENQIEGMLRQKLTAYMLPQVILIESVPLLVNGKVDRQSLLKSYENMNNNDDCENVVDIDYAGVPKNKMQEATVLFETVASVLNRSARSTIGVNANFYEIGGNSLNSIFTISNLKDKGYHVSIGDFIAAMDLGEVLERMVVANSEDFEIKSQPKLYRSEMLNDKYKKEVIEMVTASFYEKADLERWIIQEISSNDYAELVNVLWSALVEKELSFVTISEESGKCIAVAFNFDAHDEPEVEITSKLSVIFEFLEFVEGPIRDNQLPNKKGDVLHSFIMATHSTLSAKENVAVMQFMEDEVLKLARRRQFKGILATNTSPLTQQLGSSVFGYKSLLDYQVNKYVASDNTKPFGMAPDSQLVMVHWKEL